ncbi:MAG TPA: response regulator [Streptosporangiaceae bacterium]|nr:response regulator [Streptosporangiaceae bacterium]
MNGVGRPMVDTVRADLSEKGHSELASLVVLGADGRPLCDWPKLGRALTTEDVRLVHTAMLGAYEAFAPNEIGDGPNQFTRSRTEWLKAIIAMSGLETAPILVVEDDRGDARLVLEMLADADLGVSTELVATLAEARRKLRQPVSCVLLDLGLPDSTGLESLIAVLNEAPEAAVVVFTGLLDEESGSRAVAAGAQDYLVKGRVDASMLAHAIRYAIDRKQAELARIAAKGQ